MKEHQQCTAKQNQVVSSFHLSDGEESLRLPVGDAFCEPYNHLKVPRSLSSFPSLPGLHTLTPAQMYTPKNETIHSDQTSERPSMGHWKKKDAIPYNVLLFFSCKMMHIVEGVEEQDFLFQTYGLWIQIRTLLIFPLIILKSEVFM